MKKINPKIKKWDKQERKSKVVVIASMGRPPYSRGIENVVDTLVNSTLKDIYHFYLFDTYRQPDPNRTILKKALFASRLFFLCGKFLLTIKPDLVHIHFSSNVNFQKHVICLFVARILGLKTLFHFHGGNFARMYNGYSFVAQKCVRVVFRIPHRVIVLSQYWKAFLSALMNPRRVNIIGNPIDCAKFETSSDRQKSDKGHKILLLGVVGKHKGHYDALKALPIVLKHFPNATMIFAGKADAPGETEHLQKLAQESGIATHVRFLGLVTGDAKINLLQNCSVMVLPSYGENMPLSIMEGMAAKLPVVASSVGAIPELLENGKLGILIEPGNHVTLADAIKRLLANPRLTRLMALAAYKKVKNLYDTKIIAKQIDRLYQAVMAE